MNEMIVLGIFWLALFVVLFTYFGYGFLLYLILKIRGQAYFPPPEATDGDLPTVSLLIAAFNEEDVISAKLLNSLALNYPTDKLEIVCVTDGSNDDTPAKVATFPQVKLLHQPERKGKLAAVHRAAPTLSGEIIVFTDANTLLNPQALRKIVRHYADPTVGGVSGEKRVHMDIADAASSSGEGFYWKYESKLKHWDSELYSVVGAAGELFSVRNQLFREIPPDTIIEDFFLTVSIAMDGYRIVYEPEAYAVETASADVREEYKRKVRISAGGFQAMTRLRKLFNPFRYKWLSFVFIGHRVLRWSLCPLALLILGIGGPLLAWQLGGMYIFFAVFQGLLLLLALGGKLIEGKPIQLKAFFIPYYFFVMNISVLHGFIRFLSKKQAVTWRKAKRKKMNQEITGVW